MKHYGLLGGKLGHSLSPQIHELFFKYTGIEGDYTLLETRRRICLSAWRSCVPTMQAAMLPFRISCM